MSRLDECIFKDMLNIIEALDKLNIACIISNKENRILSMNQTAGQLTGWSLEECIGLDLYDVVRLIEDESGTSLITKQKLQFNVVIETALHNSIFGQELYNITLIKGVTCSRAKEELLQISENNLRTIFDSVYDAIIIHDLHGNILDVNKRMLEMYKLDNTNIGNMTIEGDLSAENNPFEELPVIWERVIEGENKLFEWNAKRPVDKSTFEVEVYLSRISLHSQDVILANVRDISERKQAEQMIQYLSFHDKLTGLYNRAFFEKELLRLDTERQLPISIIMADVNGLKLANDAFGHLAGDELLKNAGEVFRRACRSEDIIARWGGDEFIILLTNTDSEAALRVCERIQDECVRVDMKPIALSIGLGCATKTDVLQDVIGIIKEAETLMYANKLQEGKEIRKKIVDSLLEERVQGEHDIELMVKLCALLADARGLKGSQLEEMRLLAYMHDIGKASIPVEIIRKPGKLSEKEWEIIKKHSEIGYRILSACSDYAHLADSVLSHHERWDGTGYPRKLKRYEIPLKARILSIVDAYEAMVSGRPYKAAITHEDALKEIEHNSGSQFDPELAQQFIRIMRQNVNS